MSNKGVCVKQVVGATIVALDGSIYKGTNFCNNTQKVCPRDLQGYKSGEGYHLCKDICQQEAHAEVNAISSAGVSAKGATLYLKGHTYACCDCKKACKDAGIIDIIVLE